MEETKLGNYSVLFPNKKEYHFLKREIWNQEIYYFKSDTDTPIIFDIGSHIGISVLYFKKIYPNSDIFCFEPNPTTYNILEENISRNGLRDIKCIPQAVSSSNGTTLLYIDSQNSGWDSNSSLIEGSWNGKEKTKPIQVECTTLDRYVKDIECIDMLKIDTEGTELNILKNISPILSSVKNIALEYHPKDIKNLKKIFKYLNPYFNISIYCEGKSVKNIPKGKLLTVKGEKRM